MRRSWSRQSLRWFAYSRGAARLLCANIHKKYNPTEGKGMEQYLRELEEDENTERLSEALYFRDQDVDSAIRELQDLGSAKSKIALVALGDFYLYGRYGVDEDVDTGERYLRLAAELGSIEGAYRLACHYDYIGQTADAFEIYKDLSEKGFCPATYRLAWARYQGRFLKKDLALSLNLFTKAAAKGHLLSLQQAGWINRNSQNPIRVLRGWWQYLQLLGPYHILTNKEEISDRLRD